MALAALAALAALVAVAGAAAAATGTVDIHGPDLCQPDVCYYQPDTLKVNVGDTVTWTNQGPGVHTVKTKGSPPEDFESPNLPSGQTYTRTFTVAGLYPYFCSIHGEPNMGDGAITVNALPTITLESPTAGSEHPHGNLEMSGTAADSDGTVSLVEVRINGGAWHAASGTTSWSGTVSTTGLQGEVLLEARAKDNDNALSSVASVRVVINDPPVAAFTFSPSNPKPGQSVNFTDTSVDDGNLTWSWNLGDGSSTTDRNPVHSYAAAGSYTVQLTVTDDRHDTDAVQHTVTVVAPGQEPPVANFTVSPTNPRTGTSTTFTSTATDPDGSVVAWAWEFGDNATGNGSVATHTYTAAGNFTVNLTVRDDAGLNATVARVVQVIATIGEPPNATMSVNATRGFAPLLVRFTLGASDPDGTISKFVLDYGDGQQVKGAGSALSALGSPVHNYTLPGNLTATFTVTDNDGNEASQVVGLRVDSRRPFASFVVFPGVAARKLDVLRFVDKSHDDDQGDGPTWWSWDFGDGATDCCERANVTHAYLRVGDYTASLRVRDRYGLVSVPSEATISVHGTAPLLAFTANTTGGRAPFPVTFTLGAQDLDGTVTRWVLNFGDATAPVGGTGMPPETPVRHVYERTGRFFAALRAFDDDNLQSLQVVNVTITEPAGPVLDLGAGAIRAVPLDERLTWRFTATTGFESGAVYAWSFGDGGTASGREVVYSFRAPGTFNITLRVALGGSPAAEARTTLDVFESSVQPQARLRAESALGVVRLEWDPDPRASGYQVWRTGADGRTVQADTTPGTSFTDTGLQDAVKYTYTVTFYSPDSSGLVDRLSELNRTTDGYRIVGEVQVEAKVDRDHDGVRDSVDKYPDDASRSPGFEAPAVVATLATLALLARRRR